MLTHLNYWLNGFVWNFLLGWRRGRRRERKTYISCWYNPLTVMFHIHMTLAGDFTHSWVPQKKFFKMKFNISHYILSFHRWNVCFSSIDIVNKCFSVAEILTLLIIPSIQESLSKCGRERGFMILLFTHSTGFFFSLMRN